MREYIKMKMDRKRIEHLFEILYDINLKKLAIRVDLLDPKEYFKNKTIMIFSPHPDDDVISLGGTMKLLSTEGIRIIVVYLTDGSKGYKKSKDVTYIVSKREKEAVDSLSILGINEFEFMKYIDSELSVTIDKIVALNLLLERYQPDVIFAPFFLDRNNDHVMTTKMLSHSLTDYPNKIICFLYEVWSPLPANSVIDISSVVPEKKRAINCHHSQIGEIVELDKIISLNSYRSLGLGEKITHCEAFFRCDKKTFLDISRLLWKEY